MVAKLYPGWEPRTLVLNCGHHFYAKLQMLVRALGYQNCEVWCGKCGAWVKSRPETSGQMEMGNGSTAAQENLGTA